MCRACRYGPAGERGTENRTTEQYLEFLRQVPRFEQMLIDPGLHLVKLWFSVSRAEQRTRFVIRQVPRRF
ncbi:hypothetical protein AB0F88_26810 [Streptosporangium sp. NPDC023963]|uniref:hypothetical protein n=1 Tax=Streptosporangium sp. NPDC023963 TaxID=3155608 RepID=UPI003419B3AD